MTELVRHDGPEDRKRARGRSPAYPGISLRAAVERAEMLYKAEGKHTAPIAAVSRALGFTNPGSGSATVAMAALKKYGLVDEERHDGERMLRLSSLAFDILLNPDPQASLQEAALLPPIHREMWEEYGNKLPSAETLRWKLVKRGFTESGVQDFLKVYRETLMFAGLDTPTDAEIVSSAPAEAPTSAPREGYDPTPRSGYAPTSGVVPAPSSGYGSSYPNVGMWPEYADLPRIPAPVHGMRIPVPLAGGDVVYLEGEFPISGPAFDHLLNVLQAMKPGLVKPDAPQDKRIWPDMTDDERHGA